MTLNNFAIVFVSVFLSACAQLILKIGVNRIRFEDSEAVLVKVLTFAASPLVLLGLSLYGFGAVIWLFALKNLDLSLVYPFVGMSFVITFLFGIFLLGEPFSLNRLVGCTLIVLGVIWLSQT